MLGYYVLSSGYYDAYYLKALRTKALIKQAFDKAFAKYDVQFLTAARPPLRTPAKYPDRGINRARWKYIFSFYGLWAP